MDQYFKFGGEDGFADNKSESLRLSNEMTNHSSEVKQEATIAAQDRMAISQRTNVTPVLDASKACIGLV